MVSEITAYPKIWKAGNTNVITIRKDQMQLLQLENNETIEISIKKIKKQQEE